MISSYIRRVIGKAMIVYEEENVADLLAHSRNGRG